jgi:hypothetical protein
MSTDIILSQLVHNLGDNANTELMQWESDTLNRFEEAGIKLSEALQALTALVSARAAKWAVVSGISEENFINKVMTVAYRNAAGRIQ